MSGILEKCVFVIDQSIPLKKKVELIRMIKSQAGISVYSVSEKSTHLITTQEGFNEASQKVAAAKGLGLHIVSKEFVVDSITQGTKQDEKNYYFIEGATPLPSPTVHSPKGPPNLTISVPNGPSTSSSQITPSPRSPPPPGFNVKTPPSQQPLAPALKKDTKGNFGRLRVDVPSKHEGGHQPSPSPRFAEPTPSPKYGGQKSPKFMQSEDDLDDDDDDDDDDDEDGSEDDEGKPSFRDVLESKQPRAWESATPQYLEDDGCKIFVGGIMFDDLEALKKTKDGYSASPEVIAHIQKLKNERLLEIIRIFSRFGTVVRVKQFLEKRHIFITYDNKQSALQALRALKPLEVRKKIVQEIRERLRAEDRQTIVSPRSNFYVRWPHHVDSENDGSHSPRSYFSSSSAPSSPSGPLPTQKLSWRQPQSPTSTSYQPYQRSYFNNNNFNNNITRTTSMRSYFSHSESEQEGTGSANLNSFSESEAPAYSRPPRYQPPAIRHNSDITPTSSSSTSSSRATVHTPAESDSDAPSTGMRHRGPIIKKPEEQQQQQQQQTTTSTSTQEPISAPTPTPALLTPIQSVTSTASFSREKRRAAADEGAWHKVIVLLFLLFSMAVVYFYNNKS